MEVDQGEDDMREESELREEVEGTGRLVEERLLVSALECPVCLSLPHSSPVYTCRVGWHTSFDQTQLFYCPENLPTCSRADQSYFHTQLFYLRLAILSVVAAGKVFLADAHFVSPHITGGLI